MLLLLKYPSKQRHVLFDKYLSVLHAVQYVEVVTHS